jgi:hypothetical protein
VQALREAPALLAGDIPRNGEVHRRPSAAGGRFYSTRSVVSGDPAKLRARLIARLRVGVSMHAWGTITGIVNTIFGFLMAGNCARIDRLRSLNLW